MNEVFLCLGGNLGNRLENIEKAIHLIAKDIGKVTNQSSVYETDAWGSSSTNKYLNKCVLLQTHFNPQQLIKLILRIEKKLGRTRGTNKNADRIIDIDVLLYNSAIIETETLEVPHPRMHLRNFVLLPLHDIASNVRHPILNKTIKELLYASKDKLQVKKHKSKKIICIEGNIGSGKTSLGAELAKNLKANYVMEEFEDNPLLPLFYKNPKKYSLPLEISFLLSRYNQLKEAQNHKSQFIVCDYSIYKCLWFARVNLSSKKFAHYKKLFQNIASQLPEPDLIIYLKTSHENLKKNIKKRGRPYEQGIKLNYLKAVHQQYEKGFKNIGNISQKHVEITNYGKNTFKNLIKEIKSQLK